MQTSFQTVTYQDDSERSDIVDKIVEVLVDMSCSLAVVAGAVEAVSVDFLLILMQFLLIV